MSHTTINTFIFLDLETTGLEKDCKITEICLYAISRCALQEGDPDIYSPPRIADKLVLCVDPEKEASDRAVEMTGLSRGLLQQNLRGAFDAKVANLVKAFLEVQASPACLVAHNGCRFDFPILSRHFRDVGVEVAGVSYACTLKAFKEIDPKPAFLPGSSPQKYLYNLDALCSRHIGGRPPNAAETRHSAEGDSLALLQLVHHKAEDVLPWIDQNAKVFSSQRCEFE